MNIALPTLNLQSTNAQRAPESAILTSNHMASAVDTQGLPSDPAGQIRDEKQHPVGDILGRAQALERQPFDEALLAVFAHRLPLALGCRVGAHEAGGDVVDRNIPRPQLF